MRSLETSLNQLHISDLQLKMPTATLLLSPVVGRRTSYQEIVHRECRPSSHISCPVTRLASCLAEWLVVLQKVAEDRGPEQPSASCRCEKATRLCEEIQSLGRRVSEAGQVYLSIANRVYFHSILSSWQRGLGGSCLRACLKGWAPTSPRWPTPSGTSSLFFLPKICLQILQILKLLLKNI